MERASEQERKRAADLEEHVKQLQRDLLKERERAGERAAQAEEERKRAQEREVLHQVHPKSTCFTSTEVQILPEADRKRAQERRCVYI